MKRTQIIILFTYGLLSLGLSQSLIKTDSVNYIEIGGLKMNFVILDSIPNFNLDLFKVPVYSPGEYQFVKNLKKSVRFPEEILEDSTIYINGFEAIVTASFIIDKNGDVKNLQINNGFNKSSDKDIINFFNRLPKFQPGKYDNKPIDIKLLLQFKFKA
jgi:protein TonB